MVSIRRVGEAGFQGIFASVFVIEVENDRRDYATWCFQARPPAMTPNKETNRQLRRASHLKALPMAPRIVALALAALKLV